MTLHYVDIVWDSGEAIYTFTCKKFTINVRAFMKMRVVAFLAFVLGIMSCMHMMMENKEYIFVRYRDDALAQYNPKHQVVVISSDSVENQDSLFSHDKIFPNPKLFSHKVLKGFQTKLLDSLYKSTAIDTSDEFQKMDFENIDNESLELVRSRGHQEKDLLVILSHYRVRNKENTYYNSDPMNSFGSNSGYQHTSTSMYISQKLIISFRVEIWDLKSSKKWFEYNAFGETSDSFLTNEVEFDLAIDEALYHAFQYLATGQVKFSY